MWPDQYVLFMIQLLGLTSDESKDAAETFICWFYFAGLMLMALLPFFIALIDCFSKGGARENDVA